jgi:hypothetical protein
MKPPLIIAILMALVLTATGTISRAGTDEQAIEILSVSVSKPVVYIQANTAGKAVTLTCVFTQSSCRIPKPGKYLMAYAGSPYTECQNVSLYQVRGRASRREVGVYCFLQRSEDCLGMCAKVSVPLVLSELPDTIPENPGPTIKKNGRPSPIEVLSDTRGVDFGPYLSRVAHVVRLNWYNLIPEIARPPLLKKGKVSIEFAIMPNGSASGMQLVASSGDVLLDRAAWGGITMSNPFEPLPQQFDGPYLALRFNFYYNPDKGDLK